MKFVRSKSPSSFRSLPNDVRQKMKTKWPREGFTVLNKTESETIEDWEIAVDLQMKEDQEVKDKSKKPSKIKSPF